MEKEVQVFKYQRPEFDGVKKSIPLCNSDILKGLIQVVKKGGENNLHAHTGETPSGWCSAARSSSTAKGIS